MRVEVGGGCEPLNRVECTHCVSPSEKTLFAGRAMAQVARNTLLMVEAVVKSRVASCEIPGERRVSGGGFPLTVFSFLLIIIIAHYSVPIHQRVLRCVVVLTGRSSFHTRSLCARPCLWLVSERGSEKIVSLSVQIGMSFLLPFIHI